MKVILRHRHYGVHELVAESEVPGAFGDYASPPDLRGACEIDEEKLLAALPDGFLPASPRRVLLCVEDEDGGTGQTGLTLFRNWAKYFDAYVLNLLTDAQEAVIESVQPIKRKVGGNG